MNTNDSIEKIIYDIRHDMQNAIFENEGQLPLFSAPPSSRILRVLK